MFCTKCGAKIPEMAKFCSQCGIAVEIPQQYAQPQQFTQLTTKSKYVTGQVPLALMYATIGVLFIIAAYTLGYSEKSYSVEVPNITWNQLSPDAQKLVTEFMIINPNLRHSPTVTETRYEMAPNGAFAVFWILALLTAAGGTYHLIIRARKRRLGQFSQLK